jgi:hypothetical protein
MKKTITFRSEFDKALTELLAAEFRRGKAVGLQSARVIRDWLTQQPDTARQKRVREWADKEISRAEID